MLVFVSVWITFILGLVHACCYKHTIILKKIYNTWPMKIIGPLSSSAQRTAHRGYLNENDYNCYVFLAFKEFCNSWQLNGTLNTKCAMLVCVNLFDCGSLECIFCKCTLSFGILQPVVQNNVPFEEGQNILTIFFCKWHYANYIWKWLSFFFIPQEKNKTGYNWKMAS